MSKKKTNTKPEPERSADELGVADAPDAVPPANGHDAERPADDAATAAAEDADAVREVDHDEQLATLRADLEQARDERLRLLAEFKNSRERWEHERFRLREDAKCDVFAQLLPILHDLERAQEAARENEDPESIAEGIDLVRRRFGDFLRKEGIEEVDPIGEPFDEATMEAMGMVPSSEHEEGRVAQVFQRGLLLGERLIEPARVLVSSGPPADASE